MKLHPYFIFNGQAKAALDFYSAALGLEIGEISTYGSSPVPHQAEHRDWIMHAALNWKGETLGVLETRRHYTNYFKGIPHFKEYRIRLVTSNASEEVFATLADVESAWGDYVMV